MSNLTRRDLLGAGAGLARHGVGRTGLGGRAGSLRAR